MFDDVSDHEFDFEVETFPIYNTTCVFENNEVLHLVNNFGSL